MTYKHTRASTHAHAHTHTRTQWHTHTHASAPHTHTRTHARTHAHKDTHKQANNKHSNTQSPMCRCGHPLCVDIKIRYRHLHWYDFLSFIESGCCTIVCCGDHFGTKNVGREHSSCFTLESRIQCPRGLWCESASLSASSMLFLSFTSFAAIVSNHCRSTRHLWCRIFSNSWLKGGKSHKSDVGRNIQLMRTSLPDLIYFNFICFIFVYFFAQRRLPDCAGPTPF